jgi:hypothetical protein
MSTIEASIRRELIYLHYAVEAGLELCICMDTGFKLSIF